MNTDKIAGALIYSHDTATQFEEFKELFVRSGISVGSKLNDLSIEQRGPLRMLVVNGEKEVEYFLLRVMPLEYFSVATMKHLNEVAETILKSESLYGLKDLAGLEQILALTNQYTFGREYHPSVIDKSAYLWTALATKQLFHNGNKRTALLTGMLLLERNFITLKYRDVQQLYDLSVALAKREVSEFDLRNFIKENTQLNLESMRFYSKFYGLVRS
ncbi:Fic family protein [Fructobacillus durionis]|uniref:Death on curing protein n=1 Tax=Fructobacillus durionis TaxID=283737 RepID=A0A1I1FHH0_9LACO|nr:Fic family protein [Fructobacillus durionis]SFB97108.1 death on curing protein [Fructobacillus durionis]